MEQIISHGNKRETYNEFIDKFKPKRTTDDCFTPKPVYDAVLQFEILNQPHSHFYEKNEAILNIDKIYQESKYLGELDKKPNVRFDSYLFETSIAGDKSWIIVKKFEFNRQAIIYSISDSDKLLDYIKKKVP